MQSAMTFIFNEVFIVIASNNAKRVFLQITKIFDTRPIILNYVLCKNELAKMCFEILLED